MRKPFTGEKYELKFFVLENSSELIYFKFFYTK